MQWVIDIVKAWLELYLQGMIVMWSGGLGDIPTGWALCNGENGTPDLRYKFIYGAGPAFAPHQSGGNPSHTHNFTGDGHFHSMKSGLGIAENAEIALETTTEPAVGTTDSADHIPPYYSLAFIMKT